MGGITQTRDIFLWCISVIYLFAFGSLYHQIPGLYGDNGILPAKWVLRSITGKKAISELLSDRPTLLWFAPYLGLNVQLMLDLLALSGTVLAFCSLISKSLRGSLTYAALWGLYLSVYNVGQTFLWFQWDSLLLEAGFLSFLVALTASKDNKETPSSKISMWLVRWLLFRLMFASGVVKLTSQCPTWWGLTALNHHFESQCIPTPVAWYAHHLPEWALKLAVVGTYLVEIPIPFLFFSPLRTLRLFSFWAQILFQVMIIVTGNYNFFNLLTMALCISLLDDDHVREITWQKAKKQKRKMAPMLSWLVWTVQLLIECAILGTLAYWTVVLFSLKIKPGFVVESVTAFTPDAYQNLLEKALIGSVWLGSISLALTVLYALYQSLVDDNGVEGKVKALLWSFFLTGVAVWIFGMSMVPHTSVHRKVNQQVWPVLIQWYDKGEQMELVHSYGLFRRMTGITGRPEVVLEGSNSLQSGWKEYNFLYKTGSLSTRPPFVAPHQPRLDWQMWFVALGPYNQSPWFIRFVSLLLQNQPEVLALLDGNPFPKAPPKYMRATSYLYSYSPWDSSKRKGTENDWWTRKKVGEFLPAVTKDHESVSGFLQSVGLYEKDSTKLPINNTLLASLLELARQYLTQLSGPMFLWALLGTAMTIRLLNKA